MLDQGNRTFIGSVVFVDIIGYSRKSVSEQILIKDRFTNLLSDALSDISPEQRLILDTGDGAALSFLGDPEDALFVSMNLRDLVSRASAATAPTASPGSTGDEMPAAGIDLPLRIGINLGPVKLARDINGHPNIVGDGINVAQRIMSFAQIGQIVVSRSFYDVVSVISEEYAKLFHYEGSRTDKHVREHEIYVVGESESALKKARAGMVDRAATNPHLQASARAGGGTGTHGAASGALPFFQDQRKLMLAGGALGLVVLALVIALMTKKPADSNAVPVTTAKPDVIAAAPKTEPAAPAASTTSPAVPAASQDAKPADTASAVKSGDAAAAATGVPPAATSPTHVVPAPVAPPVDAKIAKAEAAKQEAAKSTLTLGTVFLNIDPWGEVFINGKSIGTSPPVKQHKLAPGKYKLEVRNTSFTPYVSNIEVKAKEDLRIKHKFQ